MTTRLVAVAGVCLLATGGCIEAAKFGDSDAASGIPDTVDGGGDSGGPAPEPGSDVAGDASDPEPGPPDGADPEPAPPDGADPEPGPADVADPEPAPPDGGDPEPTETGGGEPEVDAGGDPDPEADASETDAPEPDASECPAPAPGCVEDGAWTCAGPMTARLCDADPATGCLVLGPPKSCNDGSFCTEDACEEGAGCTHDAVACDDGDACNGVETCDPASGCLDGKDLTCDDGKPCNGVETCEAAKGCLAGAPPSGCCALDAECDDGDPCDGTTICEEGKCEPGAPPLQCEDGDVCNGIGKCVTGTGCVFDTPAPDCDDDDPCTADSCVEGQGCHHDPAGANGETCGVYENGTATCSAGTCKFECLADHGNCDGKPDNGCETYLLGNPTHCGTCQNTCKSLSFCDVDTCVSGCPDGQEPCGGVCLSTQSDPAHCGSCTKVCTSDDVNFYGWCAAGNCQYSKCAEGTFDADGDPLNQCECKPEPESCNGEDDDCDQSFDEGFDLDSDPAHCGECGKACVAGTGVGATSCFQAKCAIAWCQPGQADADGKFLTGCEKDVTGGYAEVWVDVGASPAGSDGSQKNPFFSMDPVMSLPGPLLVHIAPGTYVADHRYLNDDVVLVGEGATPDDVVLEGISGSKAGVLLAPPFGRITLAHLRVKGGFSTVLLEECHFCTLYDVSVEAKKVSGAEFSGVVSGVHVSSSEHALLDRVRVEGPDLSGVNQDGADAFGFRLVSSPQALMNDVLVTGVANGSSAIARRTAGIQAEKSDGLTILGGDVAGVTGGSTTGGGGCGTAGDGTAISGDGAAHGDAAGILVESTADVEIQAVTIQQVFGGGPEGTARYGGRAAGVRLESTSDVAITQVYVYDVAGGEKWAWAAGIHLGAGANGTTLEGTESWGIGPPEADPSEARVGYGVFLDPLATGTTIPQTNLHHGQPILYFEGAPGSSVTFDDLVLDGLSNPTNLGRVVSIGATATVKHVIVGGFRAGVDHHLGCLDGKSGLDAVGIRIQGGAGAYLEDVEVSNVAAGPGFACQGSGCTLPGDATGLLLDGTSQPLVYGALVTGVMGGTGAAGDVLSQVGTAGGSARGVHVLASPFTFAAFVRATGVTGGDAGKPPKPDGSKNEGGGAAGVDLGGSSSSFQNLIVADVKGGPQWAFAGPNPAVRGPAFGVRATETGFTPAVRNGTIYGIAGTGASGVWLGSGSMILLSSLVSTVTGTCTANETANAQNLAFASGLTFACTPDEKVEYADVLLDVDPLLVDPAAGDFHETSASLAVDWGKEDADYSQEPAPNGCRINVGAYGNTPEAASKLGAAHCP